MGFIASTSQGTLSNSSTSYPFIKEWQGVISQKQIIIPESRILREINIYSDKKINLYWGDQSIPFYTINNQVFIDNSTATSLSVEPLEEEANIKILLRAIKEINYTIGFNAAPPPPPIIPALIVSEDGYWISFNPTANLNPSVAIEFKVIIENPDNLPNTEIWEDLEMIYYDEYDNENYNRIVGIRDYNYGQEYDGYPTLINPAITSYSPQEFSRAKFELRYLNEEGGGLQLPLKILNYAETTKTLTLGI